MKKREKWVKKVAALLLCAAMTITAFPAEILAAEEPPVQTGAISEPGQNENRGDVQQEPEMANPGEASETTVPNEEEPAEEKTMEDVQESERGSDAESGSDKVQEEIPQGEIADGQEQAAGAERPVRTVPIDWGNHTDDLKVLLNSVFYQETDGEREIQAADSRADLSGITMPGDRRIKLQFALKLLRPENEAGDKVQAGDTFALNLKDTVFSCSDRSKPEMIRNEEGQAVAEWTCKENKIMVTFRELEGIEDRAAKFAVEAEVQESAIQEAVSEAELILQRPEGMDPVKAVLILPAKVQEEVIPEETVPEEKQDAGEDGRKTGDKPDGATDPVSGLPDETDIKAEDGKVSDTDGDHTSAGKEEEGLWEFFTGRVRSVFSAAAEFFAGDADTITTKSIMKNPQEGVSKVLVAVTALKDGYNKDSADRSFQFGVDMTLDSAYLKEIANQFSGDPDFPDYGRYPDTEDGYTQYQKDIDTYFENNGDVPSLVYKLDIGQGYLLDEDGTTPEHTKYITEDGKYLRDDEIEGQKDTIIGVVNLKQDVNNRLVMNVAFRKRIYNRTNIKLGCSETLYIDKDELAEEMENVTWKAGELKLVPVGGTGGDTEPDNQPFTVDKSGPETTGQSRISYTINVMAPSGKTLDGMVLKETLPTAEGSALNVFSLTVNGEVKGSEEYQVVDGKLVYAFPAEQNLTYAEIVVGTEFTNEQKDALTAAVSQNPTGFPGWKLTDQAALYAKPEDTAPAAESDEIKTTVKPELISKEGVQDSINGDKFHWTIRVDTEFIGYSITGAYLIDYINKDAHSYQVPSNIKVAVDGGETYSLPATEFKGDGKVPGELNTQEDVSALIGSLPENQAYYYECGDYAVMLIPYIEAYRNHKTTITYDTNLVKQVPADGIKAENAVKFVWDYHAGGPGKGVSSFDINIDKTGNAKPADGSKAGLGYDEKTQTAKWRFQVNYYPAETTLKNVQIRETFLPDKQELLADSISYTRWNRKSGAKESGTVPSGSAGDTIPYYTYTSDTGEFVLYLGDVRQEEYYDIRMNTKVVDGDALDGNGTTFTNKAQLSTEGPDGSRVPTELEGSVPVHATWIQKDAVGKFNYKEKTFTWTTTVNPNHLRIKNPVVKDVLPKQNSFGKLLHAEKQSADGTVEKADAVNGSIQVGGITIKAAAGDTGNQNITIGDGALVTTDTFLLTYTTVVEDEAYQDFIKSHDPAETMSFTNQAVLGGSYVDPSNGEFPVTASDDAENSFTAKLVEKNGEYFETEGKITWEVVINREQMDMNNIQVIEDLTSMLFLELVTESVKIYAVDVDEKGEVTADPAVLLEEKEFLKGTGDKKTNEGFRFSIPDKYRTTTLKLVFDTCFTESVMPSEVKNKITLSVPGIDYASNESDGNMSGDFDIDDYVTIATTPVLKLYKQSANEGSSSTLPLTGAEFFIQGYSQTDTAYTPDSGLTRTVLSRENGNAVFVNLSANILYSITEQKAPAGYQKIDEPQYYLFIGKEDSAPVGELTVGDKKVNASKIHIYRKSDSGVYKDDQNRVPSVTFINTPLATNKITFCKVGAEDQALSKVSFSLTPKDADRIGKETWKSQSADETTGIVTFDQVDPGIDAAHPIVYTLKETKNKNDPYDQGQTFDVKVWMEGGNFTYSMAPADDEDKNGVKVAEVTKADGSDTYTIKNSYRTGTVKLKKVDAVTGDALYSENGQGYQSVRLAVVDVAGQIVGAAKGIDNKGVVSFEKIPYSPDGYRIVEMSAQPGYVMPETAGGSSITIDGTAYPVVKTITKDEMDTAAAKAKPAEGSKKAVFVLDYTDTKVENNAVKNDRVTGQLSFTKKNDSIAGTALAGRTFKLWHVAENQNNDTDSYYKGAAESRSIQGKKCWLIAKEKSKTEGAVVFEKANQITPDQNKAIAWGEYFITEDIPQDDEYKPIEESTAVHITPGMLLDSITAVPDKTAYGTAFDYKVTKGSEDGTVLNELKKASLTLQKVDAIEVSEGTALKTVKEKLSGITFKLTGTDYYGNTIDCTETTDGEGKLNFSDLPVSEQNADKSYEPYTLTESRPQGYAGSKTYYLYVIPDNAENVSLTEARAVVKDSKGADAAVLYDSKTADGDPFEIDNEPIKGTLAFRKNMESGLSGLNGSPLAGAEFILKRMVNGQEYDTGKTAVSDTAGRVEFNDIEFGNYRLYEKKSPEGYQLRTGCAAEITKENILEGDTAFTDGKTPDRFTCDVSGDSSKGQIVNTLITKSLSLKKTSEDGTLLKDVTFNVYRRGDEVEADGTGLTAGVPSGTKTYGAYLPVRSVTTGEDGLAEINSLPYGDYLLAEQPGSYELQDDKNHTALWVSVRAEGVTVKQTDTLSGFAEGITEIDPTDWTELSSSGNQFMVVNHLKYGFVRLTKETAEKDKDGRIQPTGFSRQLAGATFEISKEDGTRCLTLVTDEGGQFVRGTGDKADAYYDAVTETYKHLPYGTYIIEETEAPDGFGRSTAAVEFKIGTETGHRGTAWITMAGNEGAAEYQTESGTEQSPRDTRVLNEILRSGFTIRKTDIADDPANAPALSGAVFIVQTEEQSVEPSAQKAVAALTERMTDADGEKGTYDLTAHMPEGYTRMETNGTGDPYLYYDGAQWKLLPGTYIITEIKAPDGYKTGSFTLTLGTDGAVTADKSSVGCNVSTESSSNQITMADTRIRGHVTLQKVEEDTDIPVEGAVFDLYREGTEDPIAEQLVTDAEGKWTSIGDAVWSVGLEEGTYYFKEVKATAETVLDAEKKWTFSVKEADHYADTGRPVAVKAENKLFQAEAALKKAEDEAHGYAPVERAQFKLEYKASGAPDTEFTPYGKEQQTGTDGMLIFTGLIKGEYRISETANPGYDLANPFTARFEVKDSDHKKTGQDKPIDLTTDRLQPEEGSEDAFVEGVGIINIRRTGSVTLRKVDGEDTDRELEGVTFTLFRQVDPETPDSLWKKLKDFFTGKKYKATGEEISGDELISKGTLTIEGLDWGTYKLEETKAAAGYKNDRIVSAPFTISREGAKQIELKIDGHDFYNYQNEVKIQKQDAETGVFLAGAEFTVTEQGQDTPALTGMVGDGTGDSEKGILHIKGILTGGKTYVLHEKNPPAGYVRAEDIVFTLSEDGTIEIEGTEQDDGIITVKNSRSEIKLRKISSKPDGDGREKALSGAEFAVYEDQACTKAALLPDGTKAGGISDENGEILLKGLALGEDGADKTYYLKEITAPDGYKKAAVAAFTLDDRNKITIGNENAVVSVKDGIVILKDEPIEIRLEKQDSSDKERRLKGAEFALTGLGLDGTGTGETQTVTTGEDGSVLLPGMIQGHWYTLKETKAPAGYRLASPVPEYKFQVQENGFLRYEKDTTDSGDRITVTNTQTKLFVEKIGSDYVTSTGKEENVAVSGAVLQIVKAEEPDKMAAEPWTTGETPEEISKLEPGNYILQEKTPPSGYLKAEDIPFTLEKDNTVTIAEAFQDCISGPDENGCYKITMTDKYIRGHVRLTKVLKDTDTPVAGVTFNLYKQEEDRDVLVAEGLETNAGGQWTTLDNPAEKKNEAGKQLKDGLEAGSYFFKEVKAASGTVLEKEAVWKFEITDQAHDAQTDTAIEVKAENKTFTAAAVLKKTEDEAYGYEPIEKAQFKLEYKEAGAPDDAFRPYKVLVQEGSQPSSELTTKEDGTLAFTGLIKGVYRITETADTGYVYDPENPFTARFTVTEEDYGTDEQNPIDLTTERLKPEAGSEAVFEEGVGITNIRQAGSVTLCKVDGEKVEKELKGVTFTLYRQKEAGSLWEKVKEFFTGKKYKPTGEEISGDALTTEGTLTIEGLEWGTYKLEETAAITGYKKGEVSLEFTVGRDHLHHMVKTDEKDGSLYVYNYQNEVRIRKEDAKTGSLLAGAGFTVTEQGQDKPVFTGTVGDGTAGTEKGILTIKGILTGGKTYVLHEQNPPAGYRRADDIIFTLEEDGTVKLDGEVQADNVITVQDALTEISFYKYGKYNEKCSDMKLGALDPEAAKPLAGAEFTVYTDESCTNTAVLASGEAAVTESGNNGKIVIHGLSLGDNGTDCMYYVKETRAPAGYKADGTVYAAKVTSDGNFAGLEKDGKAIADNTVVNDVYRTSIRFTKVDEKDTDKILPGSTYGLYKPAVATSAARAQIRSGNANIRSQAADDSLQLIATAVTDGNGVLAFDGVLMNTAYTIRELEAPDGCVVSEKPIQIAFRTDEDGVVYISHFDDGSGTASIDPETGEIIWLEPQTEVEFIKTDEDGNLLAGAAIQIEAEDGTLMASFTSSSEESYMLRGILTAGETYRMTEIKAPDGYDTARPIVFTVEDEPLGPNESRVQKVVMVDKKTPQTPGDDPGNTDPEGTQPADKTPGGRNPAKPGSQSGKSAGTGDTADYIIWLFVLALSGGILLRTGKFKKDRKK